MYIEAGRCYIQMVLTDGATVGSASAGEIDEAASQLISNCALLGNSGGVATNIGPLTFETFETKLIQQYQVATVTWRLCWALMSLLSVVVEQSGYGNLVRL